METRIYWTNVVDMTATAHLLSNGGDVRSWPISNVREFIDEYYKDKIQPAPPLPGWMITGIIGSQQYCIQSIEEAMKELDDANKLKKIREILEDFNTPKAVA
jgi:hypothetical protein